MKKLLTIFLLLVLTFACVFGVSVVVSADEPVEEQEIVAETEEPTAEDIDTLKEKLNALIAKYNAEIEIGKNFFNKYVLPALVGAAVSTFVGIIFGVKGRKGKKEFVEKYNCAATAYNEQEKRIKDLTEQRNQQYKDIDKLQAENAELKLKLTAYENLEEKINAIAIKQDRLIAGAGQAWAESPDAVRALLKDTDNE